MNYNERLIEAHERANGMVCLGLDPDLNRIPLYEDDPQEKIVRFLKSIIDGIVGQGLVNTVKPNYAFFAQYGFAGLRALQEVIDICKENNLIVILDAKRGDISHTAAAYAKEVFDVWGADAVTLSPYLGVDSIEPYLEYQERGRGIYVLAKTSNPGSADFQEQLVEGKPLYASVVSKFAPKGVGFVAGATHPDQLAAIMALAPNAPLLIPGVGTQGGSAKDIASILKNNPLHRVNASSSILYAHEKQGGGYVEAALKAVQRLHDDLRA